MRTLKPYLNFNGNTEEAFTFYKSVFGGEFASTVRFRDFGQNEMGVPEADLDKVAHIALPVGDSMLMATDVLTSMPTRLNVGNNVYLTLEPDDVPECERVFKALAEGGSVQMPLQGTEWAEQYGICTDRFGVQWMLNYEGRVKYTGQPA